MPSEGAQRADAVAKAVAEPVADAVAQDRAGHCRHSRPDGIENTQANQNAAHEDQRAAGEDDADKCDGLEHCGREHGHPTDMGMRAEVADQLMQMCSHRQRFRRLGAASARACRRYVERLFAPAVVKP